MKATVVQVVEHMFLAGKVALEFMCSIPTSAWFIVKSSIKKVIEKSKKRSYLIY